MTAWIELCTGLFELSVALALLVAVCYLAPAIARAIDRVGADKINCGVQFDASTKNLSIGFSAGTNAKDRPTTSPEGGLKIEKSID